ncbi:MAG: DUF2807 domain-containing protein [Tenuifilaceae bacterium]
MRKVINKYLFFLAITFVFTSCEKEAFFKAGKVVTQEIDLTGKISIIEVNSILEITLVQDTVNKVLVTCGENLQPEMDIYLKDEILHLNNSIKYNWTRNYDKIKIDLHLISIPQLNIRKPSFITTRDTFKTNEFFLIDWGRFTEVDVTLDVNNCAIDVSGDDFGCYKVKGKSVSATFNGYGSSFFYAEELKVQNCIVKQLSIGDIYVNVSNKLTVTIETTGRVFYYGNPSTIEKKNYFSTDKLIHLSKK